LIPFNGRKSPVHKLSSASSPGGTDTDLLGKVIPVFRDFPSSFHHVYTTIEYECVSTLYKPSGSARRTCLKTGKWSGRHFSCSPGGGSTNTFTACFGTRFPIYKYFSMY